MSRDRTRTYAMSHLLAAHTGVTMFRASASRHSRSPWGGELADLSGEIEKDRASLCEILSALGCDPDTPPQRVVRWSMGAVGHVSRSLHWVDELSSLAEMEKLRNGVSAKRVGWEIMLAAAAQDGRLSRSALEQLIERADDQSARLRDVHLQMAQRLFAGQRGDDDTTSSPPS